MLDFVATIQQLGRLTITGPSTGRNLTITPTGSWIPEEDADELVGKLFKVPCRVNGWTEKVGIFRLTPSSDQLKQMED